MTLIRTDISLALEQSVSVCLSHSYLYLYIWGSKVSNTPWEIIYLHKIMNCIPTSKIKYLYILKGLYITLFTTITQLFSIFISSSKSDKYHVALPNGKSLFSRDLFLAAFVVP